MNSQLPVVIIDLRTWFWTGIGRVTQGVFDCALELESEVEIWYIVSKNLPITERQTNLIYFKSKPFGLLEQIEFQAVFRKFRKRRVMLHSLYFNVPLLVPRQVRQVVNFYDVLTGTNEFRTVFHKIAYKIYVWSLRRHKAVILAQSNFTAQQIEKFHPFWKVVVCPPGYSEYLKIEDVDIKNEYGIDRPYWLYIGLNKPRKNLDGLVKAYIAALKKNEKTSFDLVICGPIFDKSSMGFDIKAAVASEPNLYGRIKLLGFIPELHLHALYKNASLYVVPSHLESGYSYPALEALSSGTPVLLNRVDMYNFKTSGNAVMFFDGALKDGPDSLRGVVNTLLQRSSFERVNPSECEVLSRFTWSKVRNILQSIYRYE